MDGVSLIRSAKPTSQLIAPPRRDPTVAVVYADHRGDLHMVGDGQPVGRWEQFRAAYKTRYEVEMRDFTRKAELRKSAPLTADGIHQFETSLMVSFRVRDPLTIVRRGIENALIPVYAYVLHACRNIAARFGIREARWAERAIEAHFAHTVELEEGIDIFRVQASLTLDEGTRTYLGTVEGAGRQKEIDELRQAAAIEQRAREAHALGDRPIDMVDLVRLMLERDPDNLEAPKQLLLEIARSARERQEKLDERIQHLFDIMASGGILRREDVDSFRDLLSGRDRPPTGSTPPPDGHWDAPLPREGNEAPYGPSGHGGG